MGWKINNLCKLRLELWKEKKRVRIGRLFVSRFPTIKNNEKCRQDKGNPCGVHPS